MISNYNLFHQLALLLYHFHELCLTVRDVLSIALALSTEPPLELNVCVRSLLQIILL